MELSSGQNRSLTRKVVPQYRRFDRTKPADLICMKAYQLDITRQQLADAIGVSLQYVNKLLITDPTKLKPDLIKRFAVALGMTQEELRRVYHAAALEQGFEIGPYVPPKKRGVDHVVEHTNTRPECDDASG